MATRKSSGSSNRSSSSRGGSRSTSRSGSSRSTARKSSGSSRSTARKSSSSSRKTAGRKTASKKSSSRRSSGSSRSKKSSGRRYGPKAQKSVEREMHEFKRGRLKSGSGRKVTNPKQAIAIGLSEARREGAKVPSRKRAA